MERFGTGVTKNSIRTSTQVTAPSFADVI